MSSMNEIVHIETELRNLGLTYQVMAGMAETRLNKFGLKWLIIVQYMF